MDELIISACGMEILFNKITGSLRGFRYLNNQIIIDKSFWIIDIKRISIVESIGIEDMQRFEYQSDKNTLQLHWYSQLLHVHVTLVNSNDEITWHIQITSSLEECKIYKVKFPIIGSIPPISRDRKTDYLLLPWQNGWVIRDPVHTLLNKAEEIPFWLGRGNLKYENEYPAQYSYQFAAYYSPEKFGYYFSTQDSEVYIKTMGFYYNDDVDGFSFSITNYPEGMNETTNYNMPYHFDLKFFIGDWQQAGTIYRKWAIEQPWCQPKLADKNTYHKIKNIDLWRMNHIHYALGKRTEEFFNTSVILKNLLDCRLALHWYGWNMGKHDVNYPEYISKEQEENGWPLELTKWNKKFTEEGILKIPYVNVRMWDKNTESWTNEDAQSATLRNEAMEMYVEPWQGDILKPMCPATQKWADKIVDYSKTYINEYNFDGIYLDQAASFNAMLCFDKSHPHPVGGGTWWNSSYHKIFRTLQAEVGRDKILTTESCCETYIDAFDLFLILDTNMQEAGFPQVTGGENCDPVPLFNMIYGDRALSYGSICNFKNSLEVFEFNFIRNLLWGILPTVEGVEMEELESERAGEYLKILKKGIDFFKTNRELILLGRLVELPVCSCDTIELTWKIDGEKYSRKYPSVLVTKWEDNLGNLKLLLYNFNADPEEIRVENKIINISAKSFFTSSPEQEAFR